MVNARPSDYRTNERFRRSEWRKFEMELTALVIFDIVCEANDFFPFTEDEFLAYTPDIYRPEDLLRNLWVMFNKGHLDYQDQCYTVNENFLDAIWMHKRKDKDVKPETLVILPLVNTEA